jgi:hypothetical protein
MEDAVADGATPLTHDELMKEATLAPEPLADAATTIADAVESPAEAAIAAMLQA